MRICVPQRQRFPANASLIWPSVGLGFLSSSAFVRHDHAVDAVAALHRLLVDEGLLDFVHFLGRAQTFEGGDRFILRGADGSDAGANGVAVHDDSASSALRQAAAELGAVQLEIITQSVEQGHFRLCFDGLILTVYSES